MADLGVTSVFPVRVLSYTGNLKVGTPVATCQVHHVLGSAWDWLAWCQWVGEMARLISNFYLSVAACTIV